MKKIPKEWRAPIGIKTGPGIEAWYYIEEKSIDVYVQIRGGSPINFRIERKKLEKMLVLKP